MHGMMMSYQLKHNILLIPERKKTCFCIITKIFPINQDIKYITLPEDRTERNYMIFSLFLKEFLPFMLQKQGNNKLVI